MRLYPTLYDRIKAGTKTDNVTGCWLWQHRVNSSGYPKITMRVNGKHRTLLAHRAMVTQGLGVAIEPGMQIDHECNNRTCLNPAHMDIVTSKENCRRAAHRRLHGVRIDTGDWGW